MMKLFLILSLLISLQANGIYVPTDNGSSVKFKIKNLGVNVTGTFSGLQGRIHFDPANLAASSFEASIEVSSINTGIDMRDDHLRSDDYFDVKNYPRIRFVSSKVTGGKSGEYRMTGNLTIKDVSKEISFPFKATAQNGGYQFNGEFKINRRDFKVGKSSVTLADNLTVTLDIIAPKEKE